MCKRRQITPGDESVDTEASHDVIAYTHASQDPYYEGAGVVQEFVQGVSFFKCSDCLEVSSPVKTAAVKPPSLLAFNYEVIIVVF